MRLPLLLLLALPIACQDRVEEATTAPDDRVDSAIESYHALHARILELRDQKTGWPKARDCDGMIWAGKYASSRYTSGVDIESAQIEPGRWSRRPLPPCWNETDGNVGSPADWSRDMFIAGLAPWIWKTQRLDLIQEHVDYGKANNWMMGEPLADGRTIYSPSLIGITWQILYALGGENSVNRIWPSIYTKDLDDYQAHLQVMDIWLRGEIAKSLNEADAIPATPPQGSEVVSVVEVNGNLSLHQGKGEPVEGLRLSDGSYRLLSVSETMFKRLEEHAAREPRCWAYQAMLGIYTGSQKAILDLVEDGDFSCSYARCDDPEEACILAEKIWGLELALDRLKPGF